MKLYIYDEAEKKAIYKVVGEAADVEQVARDYYEQQGLLNTPVDASEGLNIDDAELINLYRRIFPKCDLANVVEVERVEEQYVWLVDGTVIEQRFDGTGGEDCGTQWQEVSEGIGEPEIIDGVPEYDRYEYLGWVRLRDIEE